MTTLIQKLVRGHKPTIREIQEELLEICDNVHAYCDSTCPVYDLNGGPANPTPENGGCACFKDGKAMYDFIKFNT